MNNAIRTMLLSIAAAFALALSGCGTPPQQPVQPGAPPPLRDAACIVTAQGYQHVYDRHCSGQAGASQLRPEYCTMAGMQTFCGMVQNAPRRNRTVQDDGRIRYDSNLDQVVGTAGEKCGRLILVSSVDGSLVTQFPEFIAAPQPCSDVAAAAGQPLSQGR